MPKFFTDNWQYLTAFLAAIWIVGSFIAQRKSELSWKRTEFLFEQAKYLETDADLSEILRIVEDRNGSVSLDDVLADKTSLSESEQLRYQHSLDKLLNLFDRLYYAVTTAKTLNKSEIQIFGWYLDRLAEDQRVRKYCETEGFSDVIRLAHLNNPQVPGPVDGVPLVRSRRGVSE
jgi:hypothetical protein